MKNILAVVLLSLIPVSAMASGKLIIQPTYHIDGQALKPNFGVSVYEPIYQKTIFTNAYVGTGSYYDRTRKSFEQWYILKNTFEIPMADFLTIGLGASLEVNPDASQKVDGAVFGKIAVTLW